MGLMVVILFRLPRLSHAPSLIGLVRYPSPKKSSLGKGKQLARTLMPEPFSEAAVRIVLDNAAHSSPYQGECSFHQMSTDHIKLV